MNCICPQGYTLIGEKCVKTTIITEIECPVGCTAIITEDLNSIICPADQLK